MSPTQSRRDKTTAYELLCILEVPLRKRHGMRTSSLLTDRDVPRHGTSVPLWSTGMPCSGSDFTS